MILQNEFIDNGYINILDDNISSNSGINLEDLFDIGQEPKELLGIYISKYRDELFFLLNGDDIEIEELCDKWDDKIRVFTISNGKSEVVQRLKYNIVQLIIYSKGKPDKTKEGHLIMSRKIIIKGELNCDNQIIIDDADAVELPFHMVPSDAFAPDEVKVRILEQLLPDDDNLLSILKKERKRSIRKRKESIREKFFNENEYIKLKEWLER